MVSFTPLPEFVILPEVLVLPEDWTNLVSVLLWLAGIGAPMIVGYIMSLVLENWPQWHNLPRWVKFLSPMLASVLITFGARWLLAQEDLLTQIAPIFSVIVTAILTYLASQKGYMEAKAKDYASKARNAAFEIKQQADTKQLVQQATTEFVAKAEAVNSLGETITFSSTTIPKLDNKEQ